MSSKYVYDKFVTLTGSFEVDFSKGSKCLDFSKPLFTPMGYQIELNYWYLEFK